MPFRILLVEDDPDLREGTRQLLEMEGYTVSEAGDGVEALKMVAVECPDLILLDVMMPGLSGFQVLRQLKSDPGCPKTPVIMLTARGGDTDVMDGWSLGADAYLTKPYDYGELISFVSRFLSSTLPTPFVDEGSGEPGECDEMVAAA